MLNLRRIANLLPLAAILFVSAALPAQTVTPFYNFPNAEYVTALVQGADGNFYGTGLESESSPYGSIVKITPSGTLTTLYTFTGLKDGKTPGSLIQGADGDFYGTTAYGGSSTPQECCGAIFKITPSGTFTVLHDLSPAGDEGASSGFPLVQGSDGNFYGTLPAGGADDQQNGTIFKITPSGNFSVIYPFPGGADGGNPGGSLIQGTDGDFWGNTNAGGSAGNGLFYKVTSSGTLSVIASIPAGGYGPTAYGPLAEGNDGNFYGTGSSGSETDQGVIYQVTPAGAFKVLYGFQGGNDGAYPLNGVTAASDGNFYGAAGQGGPHDYGTLFEITPSGTFTALYLFTGASDGGGPNPTIIQGGDGNFYGTDEVGGADGGGVAFKFTPKKALPAAVQLSFASSSTEVGSPVNLTWSVANAFSLTMQQCYAFIQGSPSGAGIWNGKQTGTYSTTTKLFTGLASITPTTAGTYTYALTCGGIESGFATLNATSGKSNSTTTVIATPSAPSVGQSVSLKATVTGPAGTPTGSVAFAVSGISLGSVNLNSSGIGTLTASTNGQAPGSYPVIATYSGDSSYNFSQSDPLSVILSKAPTATTLSASPMSVTPPAGVTLTATVKRSAAGATGHPSGSVTFYAGGTVALATVKLTAGVAILKASSAGINPGSYPITAKYSGDASDSASTSSAVTVTVN